ncbi:MAG: DNA polymerase, partial [Gammaproteobacteria bacterium]|nr:DNA polymerase [Gammaproteobacteria bacterium]
HFLRKGTAGLKLVSSTNYFDFSLEKLGELVGLPKLKVDFEQATDDNLCIYCFRDVEILYEALMQYMDFNRTHDTGRFGYTKASQALNAYRHRFMTSKIFIHQEPQVVDLERSAYFGGRVECNRIGEIAGGEKTFLDVNSMYPFVMRENRYPIKLRLYFEGLECKKALRYLQTSCCVAEVSLSTDEPIYALRREGKLIFPVGTFRTFLCTGGLIRAYERGHLKEIHRIAVYESDYIFKSYVDYWYPLKVCYKQEGNVIYTKIVKLFLNSLYGKFGQKQPVIETYLDPEAGPPKSMIVLDAETGKRWIEYQAFGKIHRQIGEENGDKSFVAIAAHVAEYSRLALWDLCAAIGIERVYYMDTDSITVLSDDIHRLDGSIHPDRLGALSVDKVCSRLVLYGPKHYQADEKRVCKGVPKSAEQLGEHTYRYEQFMGSRSHQRIGETEGFLVRSVLKDVTPTYDKGEVLPDGQVIPWVLNEGY